MLFLIAVKNHNFAYRRKKSKSLNMYYKIHILDNTIKWDKSVNI